MRPGEFDAYLRAAAEEDENAAPKDMLRQLFSLKGV